MITTSKSELGLGLFLSMLLWGQMAQAQTCNSNITPTAPDGRYQNNGDGTITDLHTGLMWQQCSVALSGSSCATGSTQIYTWNMALQAPETVNNSGGFATYTDWRLPNIKELRSLVEQACYAPAINATIFPNTSNDYFWSASLFNEVPGSSAWGAWSVNFKNGNSTANFRLNGMLPVRLVRFGE